jgi:DNA-binding NtrC family response regulator
MSSRTPPGPTDPSGRTSGTLPQMQGDSVTVPRIELVVEREAGQPARRAVVLDGEFFRVGSHPSNNLVLDDRLVSRFHLSLARAASGWRLTDTGSLNGTRLGGIRVRDADLALPECRIELGESLVVVRELGSVSRTNVPPALNFGSLYGMSVAMRRLFELLKRVGRSDSDVLIEGESGTGKELIAAELVRGSARADKPLVVVDCGAISPQLIESELFGHLRGAFTGALRDRAGAFEEADGGTVFLDEIGELPLEMQPKLLRAIAQREVRRIGENRARKVDVRVIAATNRQLEREVNRGRFREDLYYRLSVLTVRVPPLRERIDDLRILVEHFLGELEATDKAHLFTPEAYAEMERYDWPGNVRELKNFVERKVVLETFDAPGQRGAGSPSMPPRADEGSPVDVEVPFKDAKERVIDAFERRYLSELLQWAGGNVSRAARKAKLDRMHLHRLLQRYGFKGSGALERE